MDYSSSMDTEIKAFLIIWSMLHFIYFFIYDFCLFPATASHFPFPSAKSPSLVSPKSNQGYTSSRQCIWHCWLSSLDSTVIMAVALYNLLAPCWGSRVVEKENQDNWGGKEIGLRWSLHYVVVDPQWKKLEYDK